LQSKRIGAEFGGKPLFAFGGNRTTNSNPINDFGQMFEENTGAKSAGVSAAHNRPHDRREKPRRR
jgi:hypothetical protein